MLEVTADCVHGLVLGWSAARPLLPGLLSQLPELLFLLPLEFPAEMLAAAVAMWVLCSGLLCASAVLTNIVAALTAATAKDMQAWRGLMTSAVVAALWREARHSGMSKLLVPARIRAPTPPPQ